MYKVAVLMSTYNGEKFLREQLDSILKQMGTEMEVYVRDDGSVDGTVSILAEYAHKHENIHYTVGRNIGYANSFLSLFKEIPDCDYFAFSDQDDIWKPDKVISAIKLLGNRKYDLYASNLLLVDEELNAIGIKDFSNFRATIGSVMSRNRLAGCSMVFHRELAEYIHNKITLILGFNSIKYGHDGYVLLFALLKGGKVIIDKKPHILFRRHSSNTSCSRSALSKRIKAEYRIFINKENRRVKISEFLLSLDEYDTESEEILKEIAYYKKTIKYRLKLFCGTKLKTNVFAVDIKNKFALMVGKY